jgi:hypothetical protein
MDNRNRDYYAPFGMDQFDFNALIRRRNLNELIDRLVEEGKAHWPSADGLASVEEQAEPAQSPTTPATPMTANVAISSPVSAVAHVDKQPRPASSVYSRDIDGNSYRSASTVRDFSSRSASFGSLLPPLMSLQESGGSSSNSSSNTSNLGSVDLVHYLPAELGVDTRDCNIHDSSVSYPSEASVASAVPAPLNVPQSGKCGGCSLGSPADSEEIATTVEPRTPERESNGTSSASSARATNSSPASTSQGDSKGSSSRTSLSSPTKSTSSSATSASNIGTPREVSVVPKRKWRWSRRLLSSMWKTFRSTSLKPISVTDSDTPEEPKTPGPTGYYCSREEFLERLERVKARETALRGMRRPDTHVWWEWNILCRKVLSLDFDIAEMVLVASDMTTCMQVPPVQFWGDLAHLKLKADVDFLGLAYERHCQEYFRVRLARRVHRRIAWLQLEGRYGSVRKIEDWYRELVDAIGWRDEDEEQLPWNWREEGDSF